MLREFFREVAGYGEDEIDELALSPVWERRKQVLADAAARAARRARVQARSGRAGRARHADAHAARQREPRVGRRSTEAYSEALPHAELRMLEGHGHGANTSGPELLAAEMARFLPPGEI